jgi:TetR/AcrR family tetracycline transcriptional repressor
MLAYCDVGVLASCSLLALPPSGGSPVSIRPYRDTRRQRRQPLDRAQVVQGALALLDEVGLDGLTMRSLADRLGVKAASLYRHVQDKQELLVLLADEISGAIQVVDGSRPWQEALADLARRARQGLLAHRDAAHLLATVPPAGPHRLRHIEAILRLLTSAGFPDQKAVRAAYHFNNFVTEHAADEARLSIAAEALGTDRRELLAEARRQFRALPPDEYPSLTRLADYLADEDADGSFEFGLRLWISGLERLRARYG